MTPVAGVRSRRGRAWRSWLAGTLATASGVGLAGAACAPRPAPPVSATHGGEVARDAHGGAEAAADRTRDVGGRMVRIALVRGAPAPRIGGTAEWRLYDEATRTLLARVEPGTAWTVEGDGARVRAVGPGGATAWRAGPLVARPASLGTYVTHDGKRYRGELWMHAAKEGVTVVNRVGLEDYLRGVVPLELGTTAPTDLAALEAQAVAARSYAFAHLPEYLPREDAVRQAKLPWDLRAGVSDQVYGGVGAERSASDRAVIVTAGLVLRWNGDVVTAPYHSTCGGRTAEPGEVWNGPGERWLRRVSDRVPGTLDRYYCDVAPRYRWTREYDGHQLAETIGRYLREYVPDAPASVGAVRALTVEERTESGRVAALGVRTDAGRWVLRGNDIRFVLRSARGDILASTYFSVDLTADGDGRVARAVLRGHGNGHGIGMCQWGAIGRSRAGQDFRAILRTYYPGTTIEPAE